MQNTIDESDKPPILVEYSKETTFHGLKYVFRAKHSIFERLFWMIILTILILFFGYFVYQNISQFVQFRMKIQENIQSTQVFEIPFPAVTICPANKIQYLDLNEMRDHFMEFKNECTNNGRNSAFGTMLIMGTQVCRKTFIDYFSKMVGDIIMDSVLNSTVPCILKDEMLITLFAMSPTLHDSFLEGHFSNWYNELGENSTEDVEKLFTEIITNDGRCFTFNAVPDMLRPEFDNFFLFRKPNTLRRDGWDPETGYSKHKVYPFKGIVRRKNDLNGLSVQLTADLSSRTDFCLPRNLGYKLILHSPSAYPHTYEQFISLEYGKDYTIAVKPETISTAKNLRSIRPEIRQCYFNDERQLKYYTFYNENNCRLECYANYTLKMFGGFPFWAPCDINSPIAVLKSHNLDWYLPNYFGSIHAYNRIYKDSINISLSLDTDCNCLPECNLIRYDFEIMEENTEILENIRIKSGIKYSETGLEIIYQQPTFIGKQRVEEYTFSNLVSGFGGLMGLFMGGSIISIFEIIYFLVIRNIIQKIF